MKASSNISEEAAVSMWIAKCIHTPQIPGSKLSGYGTLCTELLTDNHHNSIIKLSVSLVCVWKVWEGFPCRV